MNSSIDDSRDSRGDVGPAIPSKAPDVDDGFERGLGGIDPGLEPVSEPETTAVGVGVGASDVDDDGFESGIDPGLEPVSEPETAAVGVGVGASGESDGFERGLGGVDPGLEPVSEPETAAVGVGVGASDVDDDGFERGLGGIDPGLEPVSEPETAAVGVGVGASGESDGFERGLGGVDPGLEPVSEPETAAVGVGVGASDVDDDGFESGIDPGLEPVSEPETAAVGVGVGASGESDGFERGLGGVDPSPKSVSQPETTAVGVDAAPTSDSSDRPSLLRRLIEWIVVLVGAVVLALLVRTFLLQAFYIPSESMIATLNVNDRVLVNKLSYSFGDIERGDIVVFDCPPAADCTVGEFIKRVIALPGETISFVGGNVQIDGVSLIEPYVGGASTVPILVPILTKGCEQSPAIDRCTLTDGWIWVMGDNRFDSIDSRWFGPVPTETVTGRAFLRVWPLSDLGFL